MNTVKIEKLKSGGYSSDSASNYGMDILAEWFTDDVGSSISTWKNWITNDKKEDTESNATWLEKYNGKIIFGSITDLIQAKGIYTPKEEDTIEIPADNVIELLNTWAELLKTRPNEVMITEEDGVFKMFEIQ